MIPATIVITSVETTWKKKSAVIAMGGWPITPSDSFVISKSIASVGVTIRFAMKMAATPANPAARPAIGWRPTARNATAPSGMRIR